MRRETLLRSIVGAIGIAVMTNVCVADEGMHPYPLWPSEPMPGWPGVGADSDHSVEKLTFGSPADPRPAAYGQPEFLAYPGAVHHIRRDLQRYVPPYPMCNQKTLVKNFVLNEMKGFSEDCVEFAEPVYYNPMYYPRSKTEQKRPIVKAYQWKKGGAPIKLSLGKLKRSMYVIRPICAAPGVEEVWPPTYTWFKLGINDLPDDKNTINVYVMAGRVIDNFYAIQDFFFHSRGDGREFRIELSLLPESDRDVLLHNIDLHDRFAELARKRGKRKTTLTDETERHARWEENRKKNAAQWARLQKQKRTPEDQKHFDDLVWQMGLPPMNALYGNGRGIQHYDAKKLKYDSILHAPEEWRQLVDQYDFSKAGKDSYALFSSGHSTPRGPLFLDVKEGKLYYDAGGNPHINPPPYEGRDMMVYELAFEVRDGKPTTRKIRGELLGRLSDVDPNSVTSKIGRIGEIKDKSGKACKPHEVWIEGKLYKDGEPVDDRVRRFIWGYVRAYDQGLRNALAEERQIESGFYYNARVVMSLMHGGFPYDQKSITRQVDGWVNYGDRQNVRDQAMKLVHLAYDMSSLRVTRDIASIMEKQGPDRRALRHYQRAPEGRRLIPLYDTIYEFLAADAEFATAAGRYLPWIKTPDDVVEFLDTYFVQDYANRMMKFRYFYDHEQAALLLSAVLVQNDNSITDPWMAFLFTRAWEYPQALSGLGDNIVTSSTREGGTTIGSICYAIGGQIKSTKLLEAYIRHGGNKKYDLSDPKQYPAMRLTPYMTFEVTAAGRINPGIGDVGGPAEYYGRFAGGRGLAAAGWAWHKDPKFAWELVNNCKREKETNKEWAEIEAAAKQCPRDPYLMNSSRVLSDWGAYITANPGIDDFRFMREATLRVGSGWGHAHNDTLDLRLFAFGLTMAGDFNQRPAYGWPRHQMSRCHNLVEVDGKDWMGHAWTRNLFDAPGSPYTDVESMPPYGMENVHLVRRQLALVDVDEGQLPVYQSADPIGPATGQATGRKDPNVVLPSSYVFDVYRVKGGMTHTYCFHGCVDDEFQVNAKNMQPPTRTAYSPDNGYLGPFHWAVPTENSDRKGQDYWVGECNGPDLTATWRLDRKSEEYMLRGSVPTAARKYTRLILFGQKDSTIMQAVARHKGGGGYYGRCLYAQQTAQKPMENVFVALIEPYAGEPSITGQKQLNIVENEHDALKAVAVEVKTKNGHTDILFADGRPEKKRVISDQSSVISGKNRECRISGDYAYLSTDDKGLRQATVTGGKLLEGPVVKIEVETPRYEGNVSKVDYLDRKATVEGNIPARLAGHFFEVGGDYHKTSYEVSGIKPAGNATTLSLRKGMEVMRTRVRDIDPEEGTVVGSIAMFRRRGRDAGLVASDDNLKKFWRVAYTGGDRHAGHKFTFSPLTGKATGPVFTKEDFPAGSGLRVWAFGVGDTMSIRTGVSLRRVSVEKGVAVYEVYATSPCTITLRGKMAASSTDRKTWQSLTTKTQKGMITVSVQEAQLSAGKFYIKITQ